MSSQQAIYMAQVLKSLHDKWVPHETQVKVLNAIFHQGKKTIGVECGRKWGKAQRLQEVTPTTKGYIKFGDLQVGDYVFDEHGKPTRVNYITEVFKDRECYEVIFGDGSKVFCDQDHDWITKTKLCRKAEGRTSTKHKPEKATTLEIKNSLMHGKEFNHSIDCVTSPVEFPEQNLPLDPYCLGAWLAEGTTKSNMPRSCLTTANADCVESFRKAGYVVKNSTWKRAKSCDWEIFDFKKDLLACGLDDEKRVPDQYLIGSPDQRLALIQGLMEDGTISKSGHCCFDTSLKCLAESLKILLQSMGIKCRITGRQGKLYGVPKKWSYRIKFSTELKVFRDKKKLSRLRPIAEKAKRRTIVAVNRVESFPVRCIAVESENHLYLTGHECIPTHNTDIVQYTTWRGCNILGNADTYYIAPTSTQAEELIWANGRIKGFGPKELIASANETKLRLRFKSGSFLKLDGSEQFEKYRGVEPDLLMYDEYKDFHPKFHPAMEPNLGAKAEKGMGILMVVGTPPELDSHPQDPSRKHPFYELMDEIKEDPNGAYFNYTTYDNPHISRDWIERQKVKYIARGDLAGFQREHMAMRVKGGPGAIFPMFDRREHVFPHNQLMERVEKDANNLERWVVADPGTETVFGVLFAMTNPYTKDVFILDEIYAKTAAETSTGKIIPRIADKRRELAGRREWAQIYDEAAAWFCNEAASSYGESFLPTHKAWDKKGAGLNLIKDQLLNKKVFISDRCPNLIWEIENYVKDKNGRIPKVNDHLIDDFRYLNAGAGFNFEEEEEQEEPEDSFERRAISMKEDRDTEAAMEPDYLVDREW